MQAETFLKCAGYGLNVPAAGYNVKIGDFHINYLLLHAQCITIQQPKKSFYMWKLLAGVFVVLSGAGCELAPTPAMLEQYKAEVNKTVDAWHKAASEADFEHYFSYFASDTAIFMGTDAAERWTVSEFKEYSRPYFDEGRAWDFKPQSRHVYVSKAVDTAWFDEELDTPNLGPARGTGVLVLKPDGWKIAHYNLTVPIPNAIMNDVKKQIEQTLHDTF